LKRSRMIWMGKKILLDEAVFCDGMMACRDAAYDED
jgi:hypothetical protein